MKLLAAADIHGQTDLFGQIVSEAGQVDGVLLAGDLTNFGSPDDAERVVRLARRASPRVMAVAGNCDSPDIDARLTDLGVSLHALGVSHGEIGFLGVSAMPPWQPSMYHFTEDQLAEILDAGVQQIPQARRLVVLSHVPPRDTCVDRVFLGRHVGSTALRAFIDRMKPELVVCGHIHEARGVDQIGPTTVINCGAVARGLYAIVELRDDGGEPEVELCQVG